MLVSHNYCLSRMASERNVLRASRREGQSQQDAVTSFLFVPMFIGYTRGYKVINEIIILYQCHNI